MMIAQKIGQGRIRQGGDREGLEHLPEDFLLAFGPAYIGLVRADGVGQTGHLGLGDHLHENQRGEHEREGDENQKFSCTHNKSRAKD